MIVVIALFCEGCACVPFCIRMPFSPHSTGTRYKSCYAYCCTKCCKRPTSLRCSVPVPTLHNKKQSCGILFTLRHRGLFKSPSTVRLIPRSYHATERWFRQSLLKHALFFLKEHTSSDHRHKLSTIFARHVGVDSKSVFSAYFYCWRVPITHVSKWQPGWRLDKE